MDLDCVNCSGTVYEMLNNTSLNSTLDDTAILERPFQVPVGILILLAILYGSISILAVLGNTLVIIVILKSKKMQSITNIFIANLALGDVLIGLFSIPFQFQAALLQRWVVPYFLCPVAPFVKNLTVCVSVFTLTIIAIDRYIAVMYPLKAGIKLKVATLVLVNIWLFGIISSVPNLVFFEVIEVPDPPFKDQTKPFCAHAYPSKLFMHVHVFYLFFIQYLLPLLVINLTYFRIVFKIWGTKTPGQHLEVVQETTRTRNRKKVVKMLIIVVCLFVVCWMPLHIYQVLSQIYPAINNYENIHIIWFCCNWLAMSNSCYNPFVYGLLNSKFKREYQKLLSYITCCRKLLQDREFGEYSDLSAGSMRRVQMYGTQISSFKNGSFRLENQRRGISLKRMSSNRVQL